MSEMIQFCKVVKRNRFTVICTDMLEDETISWQAKGLLCYLISRPPFWAVYIEDLVRKSTNGRDGVYSMLKRLEKAGYVKREQTRLKDGKMGPMKYLVSEEKGYFENGESGDENKDCQPHPDFQEAVDEPSPEKPHPDFQEAVDEDTLFNVSNIEETNTDEKKKENFTKEKRKSRRVAKANFFKSPIYSEEFGRFWKIYPVRRDKKRAGWIWHSMGFDGKVDAIIEAIKHAIQHDKRFSSAEYTPLPSTWLNAQDFSGRTEDIAEAPGMERSTTGQKVETYSDGSVLKRTDDIEAQMERLKGLIEKAECMEKEGIGGTLVDALPNMKKEIKKLRTKKALEEVPF